jgi:hypothetical protein
MAKTKLSDLGSSVLVDDRNEKLIPALGDGSAIPGDLCYIDPSDGKAKRSDVGAQEFFSGILMESKITGTETAIVAGIPCKLVVPKSGHAYRCRLLDTGATKKVGNGITFSATPGKAEVTATLLTAFLGTLSLEVLDDDTVCEFTYK